MKKALAVLLALVFTLSFAACGGGGSSSTAASTAASSASVAQAASDKTLSNSDITVAYVTSALTTQIFRDQVTALQAYADEIGINFVYTAEEQVSDQVTAAENYISMGVSVLMVHVTDEQSWLDVMKEAQSAGIKFFAYDTQVEGADAYYGWNNYDLGYAIGENAAEWVNKTFAEGETCYAASNNYPSAPSLIEREQGYKDAVEKTSKCTIEWVTEAAGGTTDNGVTAGENYLQCGKDLNLIVGINDSGLVGVYEAFDAAGYGNDKVALFGCDSDPEALELISKDTIYRGSINTGLVRLAPDFLDICVDLANGKEGGDHWGDFIKITKDNVADFM